MTSSSGDEDPLGRIDCFQDSHTGTEVADSHVDPVTLTGSRYRYTSHLEPPLHIDLEHRPEKVTAFSQKVVDVIQSYEEMFAELSSALTASKG